MSTLKDYYKDLLIWEDVPHTQLVDVWPDALISEIETSIRTSVRDDAIIGLACPIKPESTNQSIGNQVEGFVLPRLAQNLSLFRLDKCPGSGYPDQLLIQIATQLKIPLEVKATSDWNPNDSNRRVLTSSSKKLRKQFVVPIYHVLFTILYKINNLFAIVEHVRLDFLEPTTTVSVRLEASVNHKILSHATHTSFII